MKRVITRISALTTVVALGLGAVTQAQRFLRSPATQEAAKVVADAAGEMSAKSDLLARIASDTPTVEGGDEQPFARAPQDAAEPPESTSRYANDLAGPSVPADEDPDFTERPEFDEPAPIARGQSLDEAADGVDETAAEATSTAVAGAAAKGALREPRRLDIRDSRVLGARYEKTERPEAAQDQQLVEVEPEGGQPLAADGEDAVADEVVPQDAPSAAEYSAEDLAPTAAAAEEEREPVPTSRRRAAGAGSRYVQEPATLDPLPQEQPLPPDDVGPAADEIPPSRSPRQSALPAEVSSVEGSGRPGQAELEGPQSHALELQKHFPSDAQVGKPAAIEIKLRNAGNAVARQLEIVDAIPQGTRLVATRPQAEQDASGGVRWAIASLKPGEEANVTMEVLPLVEGELGSVATVRYAAEASARATVTRPVIALAVQGPKQVLVGDDATFTVNVSNKGSGVARNLVLSNHIPEGFSHPAGSELEYEIGDLGPGENREVQLTLKGAQAGRYVNSIRAEGEGEAQAEDRSEVEVTAPILSVALGGGTRRYLERNAKFTLSVSNTGTASARKVELAAQIPPGLEFVEATHYGDYEPQSRVVRWNLEELPAGEVGDVDLTLLPVAEGEQKLNIKCVGDPSASFEQSQTINVEGIATTMFEVVDVEDPVEQGGTTSYEIRVVNQGTKAATNVQVVAVLPAGLEAVDAEGPAQHQIDGQKVLFDPLERLAPKADTSFRIKVKALQAGEMRVQVQLMTDDMKSPLSEEESTRVYSNE